MNYLQNYLSVIKHAELDAPNRIGKNGYHIHHIIPRSIRPSLIKDPTNLVKLTYKEHYIVHLQLVLFLRVKYEKFPNLWKKQYLSMLRAYNLMCHNLEKPSCNNYKRHQQALHDLLSETHRGKHFYKGDNPMRGRKHTPETIELLRQKTVEYAQMHRDELVARAAHLNGDRNGMFGKKHSNDTKNKIRQKAIGRKVSEESRKKMSESRTGDKNHFYGKHHSDETKMLISNRKKGKKTNFTKEQRDNLADRCRSMNKPGIWCFVHKNDEVHKIKIEDLEKYLEMGYVRGIK